MKHHIEKIEWIWDTKANFTLQIYKYETNGLLKATVCLFKAQNFLYVPAGSTVKNYSPIRSLHLRVFLNICRNCLPLFPFKPLPFFVFYNYKEMCLLRGTS